MNWTELKQNYPAAAAEIQKHLDGCECGEFENIEKFSFEAKEGVVRAEGPNDKIEGVPPLWYIPRDFLGSNPAAWQANGYCTGDPDDKEIVIIRAVGFHYDWTEYGQVSLNSLLN